MSHTPKMSIAPSYQSETKTIVLGQAMDFTDFVPFMRDGQIVVIDKLIVEIQGTITDATAIWDGRDVWRLIQLITVEQRDGLLRWTLSGYKSRVFSMILNGPEEHQEHTNVAIGAAQTVDLRAVIPMAKPYVEDPSDFSMPAHQFRRVTINWNTLAGAASGSAALSAASLVAYVRAEYHLEKSVKYHPVDVVKSVDFTTATQAKLACTGVVADAGVVLEDTTAGGASVLAITNARCDDLNMQLTVTGDLRHRYRMARGLAASGPTTPGTERYLEPVVQGQYLPLIFASGTAPWDGIILPNMKWDFGVGLAGAALITREVVEKSQASYHATNAEFDVVPETITMDTKDGFNTSFAKWGERQRLVGKWRAPLKAKT